MGVWGHPETRTDPRPGQETPARKEDGASSQGQGQSPATSSAGFFLGLPCSPQRPEEDGPGGGLQPTRTPPPGGMQGTEPPRRAACLGKRPPHSPGSPAGGGGRAGPRRSAPHPTASGRRPEALPRIDPPPAPTTAVGGGRRRRGRGAQEVASGGAPGVAKQRGPARPALPSGVPPPVAENHPRPYSYQINNFSAVRSMQINQLRDGWPLT